ncbi:MAG: hypothetical protein JWO27_702 [Frankiales bacterium]|jgi:uncharacterized membrane protein|nr:hypothetical protein [Frankiales bacterium]
MTNLDNRNDATQGLHQAKLPQTPLAGPYGHPFHPLLVTVPIGAWISSLVFDIATRAKNNGSQQLVYGAWWLILIGIIGAGVAALFGLMDLSRLRRRSRALRAGLVHMTLNLLVLAAFVVDVIWRYDAHTTDTKVRGGQLALSAVALGVLAISGWIGGMLSYRFGVRVAEEADQLTAYESYGTGARGDTTRATTTGRHG